MHPCRFPCGEKTAGSIMKIRAAGFSGIAAITWGAVVLTMNGKSNDGVQCVVTSRRSGSTVLQVNSSAGPNSDRRYCTGPTIHERFKSLRETGVHGN